MNSVLRHRSSSIISHYQGCLREAIRHGLLHDYEGNELVIYLLLQVQVQSGFSPSSTINFYSPLYGRPNPLDETASRVYTSHLVMIRRPISTATSDADA